ncbi:conserved membrane hypothetical protein [Flavobacterium sp. 9AF]|uniref:Mpo1 family 2-hydroxy fatty acid dioxygenase n=1 Tax=Flavobacterium sp. 9AF TaxID=2653142 RepID=UPI0012F44F0A|nr:Mpo1-like protein [Flavobacterium sp. 9AF]VXA97565.1 conserved membrane hypothetical protein [Flavobacterium sp. 9AF]
MKTLADWFKEYGTSHQNQTNKKIHYICVPTIFFSVVGLVLSIPNDFLLSITDLHPVVANWAFLILLLVLFFYYRLSVKMGIQMTLFATFCLVGNYLIAQKVPLFWFSIAIFALAWIGQFYGHKIEGKKPSFLKDLQFLLIGPAWVIYSLFNGR